MARHMSDLKRRELRLRETVHRLVAAISNVGNRRDQEDDTLDVAITAALNEAHYARELLAQCQQQRINENMGA